MKNLIKLEMKKVFSKKDVMLILGVLILTPVIFSLCLVHHVAGIDFSGQVSVDSYGIMIWSFLKYLFILYLVPIYIACCFLGKEVENRSINIMLSNEKRAKVFIAKLLTYTGVLTVFFVLFNIFGVMSYALFIRNTTFASAIEASVMESLFLYGFQWIEMIFVLLISAALCCVIKGNAVLVLGIGVIIVQKILVNIDGIKRILPYYISDYNSFSMIPTNKLITENAISLFIYVCIILALLVVSINVWRRKDF